MHKSKAADLQGVPKNRPTFGHSVPTACSLSAHLTGKTDHLMVSYGTAYVILFLIQLVNLSSYS